MKKNAVVQTMRAEDIAAVLKIQSCCYDETKLESEGSFLAKLNASPASCFIALMAESPVGYLVAARVGRNNQRTLRRMLIEMLAIDGSYHRIALNDAFAGAPVSSFQ